MVYGGFGIGYGFASIGRFGLDEERGPRFLVAGSLGIATPWAVRCANLVFGDDAMADQGPEPQPLAHRSLAPGSFAGRMGMVMASGDQGLGAWFGDGRFDRNGRGLVPSRSGLVVPRSCTRGRRASRAVPAFMSSFGSPPSIGRTQPLGTSSRLGRRVDGLWRGIALDDLILATCPPYCSKPKKV